MSEITLYDLPSKAPCAAWSPNPWKTRLALNYKGLDYKTIWVEYPDIESTLKPHVPPNDPSHNPTPYSIPAVSFNGKDYIMDSAPIAERLDRDHPTPSLYLDAPVLSEVQSLLPKVAGPLRPVWMPLVPKVLLNPPSAEYFERTRAKAVGKSLSAYATENGGEECWVEALPGIKGLGELLKKEDGPFFMGKTASYADFMVVGILHFQKLLDGEGIFKRLVEIEPALGTLYDASKQWLERNDH